MRALCIHSIYIVSAWTFESGMFSLGKRKKLPHFIIFLDLLPHIYYVGKSVKVYNMMQLLCIPLERYKWPMCKRSKGTLSVQDNLDIMAILAK